MRGKVKKVVSGQWSVVGEFTPEQRQKLEQYAALLTEWNPKINLVAPGTIHELWARHIEDSAQVSEFIGEGANVLDIGSGAGLPGLILSILGHTVQLVESDQRKSIFLTEAARVCGVKPVIHNVRVEALNTAADIITARAFAALKDIFDLTKNIATPATKFVLLKGENVATEIREAQRHWQFAHSLHPSRTGPGYILIIDHLTQKES